MGTGMLLTLLIIIVPTILFYILRIDAASTFLGLALGYLLMSFDVTTANILTNKPPLNLNTSSPIMAIALLILPPVIMAITRFHTIPKAYKLLNLIVGLGFGLTLVILLAPNLSASVYGQISTSSLWPITVNYKNQIIGLTAVLSLVMMVMNLQKSHKKH